MGLCDAVSLVFLIAFHVHMECLLTIASPVLAPRGISFFFVQPLLRTSDLSVTPEENERCVPDADAGEGLPYLFGWKLEPVLMVLVELVCHDLV